jgi:hypothetical protein
MKKEKKIKNPAGPNFHMPPHLFPFVPILAVAITLRNRSSHTQLTKQNKQKTRVKVKRRQSQNANTVHTWKPLKVPHQGVFEVKSDRLDAADHPSPYTQGKRKKNPKKS